jgi:hypothetical protein
MNLIASPQQMANFNPYQANKNLATIAGLN